MKLFINIKIKIINFFHLILQYSLHYYIISRKKGY